MKKPKPATGLLITTTQTVEVIDHEKTGAYYRTTREALGLSLREVANRLEFSASFVSDLERGRRNWTQDLANQFTRALNPPAKP